MRFLLPGAFRRGQPKLVPPPTQLQRILDLVALAGVVLGAVLALTQWARMTGPVPQHFDLSGTPDAWGDRGNFLLLAALPLLAYVALSLVSRFPYRADYLVRITTENAMTQYTLLRTFLSALKVWLVFFLSSLIWQTMRVGAGEAERLHPLTVWLGALGPLVFTLIYLFHSFRSRSGEPS